MTLQDLKNSINKVDNSFKVFLCEDNYFLAAQYVQAIADRNKQAVNYLATLSEMLDSISILVSKYSSRVLNVLIVDEFNEIFEQYETFTDCIVVCKKINNNLKAELDRFIINFPKLLDWQIKDYIKTKCSGLRTDEIDWLYTVTQGDIYKIESEISKLSLFAPLEQSQILFELKTDDNSDLYFFDTFYLSNALVSNNGFNILTFLKTSKSTISPMALISTLISDYKKILFVKFKSGLSYEQLKMSPKQYAWISRNYLYLTETKLSRILSFLLDLDYDIRAGKIELTDKQIIDFIICSILKLS